MITKKIAEYLQNTPLGEKIKGLLKKPNKWNLLWVGREIKMLDKNHPVYKLVRKKYPSAYIILKQDNNIAIVYESKESMMIIDEILYRKAKKLIKEIKISNLK